MGDIFKAFEKFLFRDVSFLLGGSVVLASIMYVFDKLPTADLPTFKMFIAAGVAYAVSYCLQDFLTMLRVVRTKAGLPPEWPGTLLYRSFDRRAAVSFEANEYDSAKRWLYEHAPQRFRDDHERIESLKQVGTSLGPCFILAGIIRFFHEPVAVPPFEIAVSIALFVLGIGLWLLGWLKVTQQAQYLIRNFRATHPHALSVVTGPKELFERWFVIPLRLLEHISSGDGGIVAFASSLYIYERYAKSLIDAGGHKADDTAFHAQLSADFGFSSVSAAELFWRVARNGFLHQGMALQAGRGGAPLPPWLMSGDFKLPVEFRDIHGTRVLCIQPWLFRDRVLGLFRDRPDLIAHSKSFPWATIYAA